MVRVRLGANERSIKSHVDLFEESSDQIFGQSNHIFDQQIGTIVFLDRDFHFKVTFF